MSRIKDAALAASGNMKIDWVERNMPVLRRISNGFAVESHFRDSPLPFRCTWRQKPRICVEPWQRAAQKCL